MKRILLTAMLASTFTAVALGAPTVVELATTTLTIGKQKVIAEVAATPDQRSTGLMYRFSLKPDHGMIFVFENAEPQSFWMKNTFIPLSIAFIGNDGRILNVADMAPKDERTHWSNGPATLYWKPGVLWFLPNHDVA